MPPKKKSLPREFIVSSRSNKRTNDSPLPDSAKRQRHADDRNLNKELRTDSYCWICHQLEFDIECKNKDCQRVYHTSCLVAGSAFVDGACPECQLKLHVNKNKFLNEERFRSILNVAAEQFRKKNTGPDKMIFFQWPNIESSDLVRIVDFEYLEDNIKDVQNPYKNFSDIVSDAKWIHHNYCILDGVGSPTAKEADGFVRAFQREISDIEDCPKCYYYMFVDNTLGKDFFLKICDPPHDLVWAKLKGSPHWPAKCLKVVNGKAHVRFFFTHDKANIPLGKTQKKCYFMSLNHPEHRSSSIKEGKLVPKKKEYQMAVEELLLYINRYERKFGRFKFHPVATPYVYEAPKPLYKKKMKVHRSPARSVDTNVVVHHDFEPNNSGSKSSSYLPLPSTSTVIDLTDQFNSPTANTGGDSNGSEGIATAPDATDSNYFQSNVTTASPPLLSESMICEVGSSDDDRHSFGHPLHDSVSHAESSVPGTRFQSSTVTHMNSHADIPGTSFQPSTSSVSTPFIAASFNGVTHPENSFVHHRNFLASRALLAGTRLDCFTDSNSPEGEASSSNEQAPDHTADDDVVYLSSIPCSRNNQTPSFFPYILNSNSELGSLSNYLKHCMENVLVRFWAAGGNSENQFAPDLFIQLMNAIKSLKEQKKLAQKNQQELKDCKQSEEHLKSLNANLQKEVDSLQKDSDAMAEKVAALMSKNAKLLTNSKRVQEGLHYAFMKNIETKIKEVKDQAEKIILEKDQEMSNLQSFVCKFSAEVNDYLIQGQLKRKIIYTGKLEKALELLAENSSESSEEVRDIIKEVLEDLRKTDHEEARFNITVCTESDSDTAEGEGSSKKLKKIVHLEITSPLSENIEETSEMSPQDVQDQPEQDQQEQEQDQQEQDEEPNDLEEDAPDGDMLPPVAVPSPSEQANSRPSRDRRRRHSRNSQ